MAFPDLANPRCDLFADANEGAGITFKGDLPHGGQVHCDRTQVALSDCTQETSSHRGFGVESPLKKSKPRCVGSA